MSTETKTATPTDSAPNNAQLAKKGGEYNGNVPLDLISPDPNNRDKISDEKVKAMADSIREEGLLQPVCLRTLPSGKYQLIAGEHRWRACKLLKLPTIAATIYRGETDLSAARKKVVENFQRVALSPIEEAKKYKELQDLGMKQADIGALLGRSQPVIANGIRLLELPAAVQDFLREGELSAAHGVNLARFVRWPAICTKIAKFAVEKSTPAKRLAKGLPFAEDLCDAKLVVSLGYCPKKELPKQYREDDDIIDSEPEDKWESSEAYCLNLGKGTRIVGETEAEEAKERQAAETSRGRTPEGKMTPAAAAERKKKISSNKHNRADTKANLAAVGVRLKGVKDIDTAAVALVAYEALNTSSHSSMFKEAAKELGVTLPAGVLTASYYNEISLVKLQEVPPSDLLRITALSIAKQRAEDSLRYAHACPEQVEILLPAKAKVAPLDANIIALHKLGKTVEQIRKELNLSESTVVSAKKRLELSEISTPTKAPASLKKVAAVKKKGSK